MNDFTTSSQNNIDTPSTGLLTSSTFPSTSSNWAIGATVAAVVALVGFGAAAIIGGNSTDAVSAAPAPIDSVVEASAIPAATGTPADTVVPTTATPAASATEAATTAPATTTPAATTSAVATPAPTVNEGPCPAYRSTNNLPLQLCDKGDWVSDVQSMLRPWNDISVDGHFGNQTERAVKYMQGELGFEQNGLVTQELLDVIAKLDPACNANGAMCDQPEEGADDGDAHWGEGPHGDHMEQYGYDDYCNDVLFDASHAQDMLDVDEQEVAQCEAWFAL